MGERLVLRVPRGPILSLGLLAAAAVLASGAPGEAEGPRGTLIERGRSLYEIHCASCHGASLKGDGPTAKELDARPTDLTRISERNDGEFPFSRLYRTIEGADDVSDHHTREMPRWGFAFQELDSDVDQRDEVRGRILQLMYYIESAQVGHGSSRHD